ncbi:MAG: PAS domain-containing protein [Verrucomicrobiales bacterium]|nr:PAS domain-containing protein [Verrucomicrobiales bacterium]
MSNRSDSSRLARKLAEWGVIVACYFLAAVVSVFLIRDVGGAIIPPVWLPAGVGVWALLYFGTKRWPAVLIGSVLSFLWLLWQESGVLDGRLALAGVGAGFLSIIRLLLANRLIRKWVKWPKEVSLESVNPYKLYAGAFGGNMLASILITILWVQCGVYAADRAGFYIFHGFFSGGLGLVSLLPVLLIVSKSRELAVKQRLRISFWKMPVTMGVALIASVVLLRYMRGQVEDSMRSGVREQATAFSEGLRRHFDRDKERAISIQSFWDSSVLVDREEFGIFSEYPLTEGSTLKLMGWAPLIQPDQEERLKETAAANAKWGGSPEGEEMLRNFHISPPRGANSRITTERMPVFFLEPLTDSKPWLGLDLLSVDSLAEAVEFARASAESGKKRALILSAPLQIEGRKMLAMVDWISRPVEQPLEAPEDWIQNLPGVALGVIDVEALIRTTLKEQDLSNFHFVLEDIADLDEIGVAQRIFSTQFQKQKQSIDIPDIQESITMDVGPRKWRLTIYPMIGNVAIAAPYGYLGVQFGVLFIEFLLGILLFQSMGAAVRMEREIRERTTELRESEERFRQISENVKEVFWMTSVDGGRMLYVSPAYESIWGRKVNDILDNPEQWIEAIHEEDRARVAASFWEKAGEGDFDETYRVVRPDGSQRWIRDRGFPVKNKSGKVTRIAGLAEDITKQKDLELELKRSNDELAEFAYVASHDLREPLRMVTSFVQLLDRRYGENFDEKAREYMNFAVEGAERMRRLIDDLLDLSRIGTNDSTFNTVDMKIVVKAARQNLRIAIEESGAKITVKGEFPRVLGDEVQLIRVVQNLLSNAIKFCSKETPIITITARREGRRSIIDVTDNGDGIPEDQWHRIFLAFQRFQGDRETSGSGIGLAVCKRIIDRHGGELSVTSTVGEGSTFRFTLPMIARR